MSDPGGNSRRSAEPDRVLLANSVYLALREQILAGTLTPGTALSVPAFAASLGVSRSPVREAVQQLMAEGVAVHTPFAGARVAHIDDATIRQVFAVRRELDGLAASESATRIPGHSLTELAGILNQQRERLHQAPDDRADRFLDVEFHTLIRDTSGNRTLCDALARLDLLTHLYRSDMWNVELNRRAACAEHEVIYGALERGDPLAARTAAEAHVTGLLARMFRAA